MLVTLGASFVSGMCGFGSNIIALPILATFFDIKAAVLVRMLPAVVEPIALVWTLRKDIDWRTSGIMIAAGCVAILPGTLLLSRFSPGYLLVGLGSIVLVVSVMNLLRPGNVPYSFNTSWSHAATAGFLGGVLGGAYGVPGPPVVLYSFNTRWSNETAKGACALFFMVVLAARIPAYALEGLISANIVVWSLLLCALAPVGVALGHAFSKKLGTRTFTRAVYIVLAASAAGLLLKGIAHLTS